VTHRMICFYTRYVATLSLALATLNLLPLPQLDGTHILSAMLSLTFGSSSQEDGGDEYDRLEADDMELGDGTTSLVRNDTVNAREKKRRWHQIVTWATGGLAVTCVGGGVILGLL
jgi:membrane-associated protease RseP (regulator of RpoE activity)